MNLNPFENKAIDYDCKAIFDFSCNSISLRVKPEIKELLKEEYGGYAILLKGINKDVHWKIVVSTGSYEGELYFVGGDGDKLYYYQTGYGSCSGCDWYEANCNTIAELQSVQDGIKREIIEFDSKSELKNYINEKVNFYGDDAERKNLLEQIDEYDTIEKAVKYLMTSNEPIKELLYIAEHMRNTNRLNEFMRAFWKAIREASNKA